MHSEAVGSATAEAANHSTMSPSTPLSGCRRKREGRRVGGRVGVWGEGAGEEGRGTPSKMIQKCQLGVGKCAECCC